MEEILKIQQQIKEIIQRTTDNAILLNIEVWKPIDGYDNYEVSTKGNVRNATTGKILKPGKGSHGYYIVVLYKNSIAKSCTVHKLVAQTFIGNAESKPFVDHIDNDRLNNNVSNLRWVTYSENNQNQSKNIRNTSGVKGISYDKKRNKWDSRINVNGKIKFLGLFLNKDDAVKARQEASKKYYGEFRNKCEQ